MSRPLRGSSFDRLSPSARCRGYLWLSWCCARAGEKKAEAADALVRTLCSNPWPEHEETGDAAQEAFVRFSSSTGCLRLYPSRKGTARLLQSSTTVLGGFFAGKTIYRSLLDWAANGEWQRESGLAWRWHLKDEDRDVFVSIVGTGHDDIAPFAGVPIIGYVPNRKDAVLLGLRDIPGINGLSPADRYVWLNSPPTLLQRCPEEQTRVWWDLVCAEVKLDKLTPSAFHVLGTALFNDIRGPGAASIVVDHQPPSPGDARDLVRVSHHDWLTTATTVLHELSMGQLPQPLQHHTVAGGEHVTQYLSNRPWVWSKHFGSSYSVHVFRGVQDLLALLVPDPLSAEVVERYGTSLMHPDVSRLSADRPWRVCLTGNPGTGKSVALYSWLSLHAHDDVIVVLDSVCDDRSWRVATDILEASLSAQHGVTLVIDNLQWSLPVQGDATLRRLAGWMRSAPGAARCNIIVSHWSSSTQEINVAYKEIFRFLRFLEPVTLNWPPRDFIQRIASVYEAAVRDGSVGPIPAGEEQLVNPSETLSQLVAGVIHRHVDDSAKVQILYGSLLSFWSVERAALRRDGWDDEVTILRIVCLLQLMKVTPYEDTVRPYFCSYYLGALGPSAIVRWERALERLRVAGWIVPYWLLVSVTSIVAEVWNEQFRNPGGLLPEFFESLLLWTASHRDLVTNGSTLICKSLGRFTDPFNRRILLPVVRTALCTQPPMPEYEFGVLFAALAGLRAEAAEHEEFVEDVKEAIRAKQFSARTICLLLADLVARSKGEWGTRRWFDEIPAFRTVLSRERFGLSNYVMFGVLRAFASVNGNGAIKDIVAFTRAHRTFEGMEEYEFLRYTE